MPKRKRREAGLWSVEQETVGAYTRATYIGVEFILRVLVEHGETLRHRKCPKGKGESCCDVVAETLRDWLGGKYFGANDVTPVVGQAPACQLLAGRRKSASGAGG